MKDFGLKGYLHGR
ncbi:hypothetical protein DWZ01_01655 [Collinsella sp. AF28-5AC]|nr:hypothetical protein DWZ01_01655 [Collinsella sp. AF28-5AC]